MPLSKLPTWPCHYEIRNHQVVACLRHPEASLSKRSSFQLMISQNHSSKLLSQSQYALQRESAAAAESVAAAESAAVVSEIGESNKLQGLLAWLQANGVQGIGQRDSKLGIYEGEDGDRGMLFFEDVEEGEDLIRIPLRLALSDHPNDEESNAMLGRNSPSDLRLAMKLLNQVKQGAASPWYPFIQVLPANVCSPYGCFPAPAVEELQLGVDAADLHHALHESGQSLVGVPLQQLRWALSIVHSRSFMTAGEGGEQGVRMLLPLADMFNHGGELANFLISGPSTATDNVRWELLAPAEFGSWAVAMTSTRAVEAGTEALISYGSHTSWELFLHSGFVPPRNVQDAVVIFSSTAQAVEWYLDRFPPQDDVTTAEIRALALQAAAQEEEPLAISLSQDVVAAVHHRALKLTAKGQLDLRLIAAFSRLIARTEPQSNWPTEQQQAKAHNSRLGNSESSVTSTAPQIAESRHPSSLHRAANSGRLSSEAQASTTRPSGDLTLTQSKVERVIGLRLVEMLYAPQVTSLLTDLKLLCKLEAGEEDERDYFAALYRHYEIVVKRFEEDFAALKAIAASVSSRPDGSFQQPEQQMTESDAAGTAASQKPNNDATVFDAARIVALRLRVSQKQVLWEGLQALLMSS